MATPQISGAQNVYGGTPFTMAGGAIGYIPADPDRTALFVKPHAFGVGATLCTLAPNDGDVITNNGWMWSVLDDPYQQICIKRSDGMIPQIRWSFMFQPAAGGTMTYLAFRDPGGEKPFTQNVRIKDSIKLKTIPRLW